MAPAREIAASLLLAIVLYGCADSPPSSPAPPNTDPKTSLACKSSSTRMHAMCGVPGQGGIIGPINNTSAACREAIEDVQRYCN
jgi:hypothetical protein